MMLSRSLSQRGRLARAARAVALLLALPSLALASELICRPNYDFCVEVDGRYPGDARFFNTSERRKFFIDVPASKNGLLMDLEAKKMFAVPRALISSSSDGGLTVKDGQAPGSTAYAFSIDGPIIQFKAEDTKIRVMPVLLRPPVTGTVGLDALIADRPEYREGMKLYTPDKTAMDALRQCKKQVDLDVYFATWCPHCKMYMPKLLRVLKDVGNPNIRPNLVGMPKRFSEEKGPWQATGVQTIPTVIVKVDGKEITRLGTHEGAVPEVEMAGILNAVK